MSDDLAEQTAAWWRTAISDIKPNSIRLRGYAIEELIGRIGFIDMLWLLARGNLPAREQAALLEATMLGPVDHGPHAPSIAIARMAVTCGVDMNTAISQGIGVLGDIHGGAIEQCMELFELLAKAGSDSWSASEFGRQAISISERHGGFVPGFGHRFHSSDPRTPRILELADAAQAAATVDGRFIAIARAVENGLAVVKGKRIPMNVDGAAAAVYLELGFAPAMGRALLVLSRSLGVIAHSFEQMSRKERIKGPMPRSAKYRYEGPAPRSLTQSKQKFLEQT